MTDGQSAWYKARVTLRGWDEVIQNNLRSNLYVMQNGKMLAMSKVARIDMYAIHQMEFF